MNRTLRLVAAALAAAGQSSVVSAIVATVAIIACGRWRRDAAAAGISGGFCPEESN
jgi:hypothetical protein